MLKYLKYTISTIFLSIGFLVWIFATSLFCITRLACLKFFGKDTDKMDKEAIMDKDTIRIGIVRLIVQKSVLENRLHELVEVGDTQRADKVRTELMLVESQIQTIKQSLSH